VNGWSALNMMSKRGGRPVEWVAEHGVGLMVDSRKRRSYVERLIALECIPQRCKG
jgi:hypothetical protein